MKNKLLLSMFAVSTLLLVPAIGSSGDKDAEVRTLTGCLTKAEGAHEYKQTPKMAAPGSSTARPSSFASQGSYRNRDRQGAQCRHA